ncbi:MAG: VWA domain-containing protein [Planctomycetaceae bacterium]|jgi:Ca-activated chloride channel family protein|nr:VWA domain-containing protein [Planctomycetaceae bacterium]
MSQRRLFKLHKIVILAFLFGGTLFSPTTYAQGLLISEGDRLPRTRIFPPRPRPIPTLVVDSSQIYAIKEIAVDGKLTDQIAEVNVSQTFTNTTNRTIETSFVFPLPYNGAIDQMTLLVNGKEYPAKLLDAKTARSDYEKIVRANRDPALLEWIGTGMFRTSVFPIPAGESRTVTIRYTQLLRSEHGVTDYIFPLATAKYTSKPLEKISITLNIESHDELKNVYSPTHGVQVKRSSEKRAVVKYEESNTVPRSDFRLLFDTKNGEISSRILSYRPKTDEDGYFLLMSSPKITSEKNKPIAKTVVFVLDCSGSMSGKKIEQARESLKFVLDKLNEGDKFNIVAFNSSVNTYEQNLIEYNGKTKQESADFCDGVRATGGTNIHDALKTALAMIQDKERPSYLIFLTDGQPTSGITDESKIVANATDSNGNKTRMFVFGVGNDVNSRLLDKLARGNFGVSDYVLPEENIEEKVGNLYSRISEPVLTGAKWSILRESDGNRNVTNQVYPAGELDLFAGEQMIIVGRYSKTGAVGATLIGTVDGDEKTFTFDGEFVEKSGDSRFSFIERLWAVRRIGEIIDQLDLKGDNKELAEELVRLSTQHGILTPMTSFLADDSTDLRATTDNVIRARELSREQLGIVVGSNATSSRAMKNSMQNAQFADASVARQELAIHENVMQPLPSAQINSLGGGYGGGSYPRGGRMRMTASSPTTSQIPAASQSRSSFANNDAKINSSQLMGRVQQLGNQTFYFRNNQWEDPSVTAEQRKKVQVVKQFSDEYFALVKKHGKELTQFLVLDEPVLFNFKGQTYLFEM